MRIIIISALVLSPIAAFSEDHKHIINVPPGWTCVDKKASNNQSYKVCSPPSGSTASPFFLWSRDPKAQAPTK